ncbi:hypothetical protein RD110_14865 [Rhodoferax koreense]|uniref:HTH cro/C1-type domain-containing protein n=1 Tax=Rhodoferax koreensis TaxID=1842727 RepID=A0A1P8JX29_9BURK|nr:helix-turn-helix transcriptional regulator [Rhodoferax koreense]APW38314.1 hypothetical protein RD110_14865 [Rhodoferax koreense]
MKSIADIANGLRSQLKATGMTQAALRAAAGLSARTLTLLLSGSHDFKLSTLLAVADRLGLEMVLVPKGAAAGLPQAGAAPASTVPSLIDLAQRRIGADQGADAGRP